MGVEKVTKEPEFSEIDMTISSMLMGKDSGIQKMKVPMVIVGNHMEKDADYFEVMKKVKIETFDLKCQIDILRYIMVVF